MLQGYSYRAVLRVLKGGVKNFRELNSGIKVGKMYLLVLEASHV